jgi:hypothetical protein
MTRIISRRAVVGTLASGGLLAGCGRLDNTAPANALLQLSDGLTLRAQRLLLSQRPPVGEIAAKDISANLSHERNGAAEGRFLSTAARE